MTQWQHLVTLINQLNANTDNGVVFVLFLLLGLLSGLLGLEVWFMQKRMRLSKRYAVTAVVLSLLAIICGTGFGINGAIKQQRYQKLEPQVIQQFKRVDYHHAYLTQATGETRIIIDPQRMTSTSAQHALVVQKNKWTGKITVERVVSTSLANATVVKATPQRVIHVLVARQFN